MLQASTYRILCILLPVYFLCQQVWVNEVKMESGGKAEDGAKTNQTLQGDYDYVLSSQAQSGTIPFSKAGNLIVIQAMVDSITGNFILNTGAPGLILNATYFRHLKALNPHCKLR